MGIFGHVDHDATGAGPIRGRRHRRPLRAGAVTVTIVALAMVLGLVTAGPAQAEPASSRAMSDAEFFQRPPNITSYELGDIVRSRPVQVRSLQLLPMPVDAYQLMYRTTSAKGPDVGITTVMSARGVRPTKIMSHQTMIDAVDPSCQPSRSLLSATPVDFTRRGGPLTLSIPGGEAVLMAYGLSKGWAVTVPDYTGFDSNFLVPREPGFLVLDAIRATTRFAPLHLSPKSPVGLFGYSGGGMATSWAAEEQAGYAPELNVRANVMGAPLRDVDAALRRVVGSPVSGLLPMGLASLSKYSPRYDRALRKYLSPVGIAEMQAAKHQCTGQSVLQNLWLRFDYRQYTTAPIGRILDDPVIKSAIEPLNVSGRTPMAPTYIFNAVSDEIVTVQATDRLARSYCRGPSTVTYRRDELPPNPIPPLNSPHGIELIAGGSAALVWLTDRMNSAGNPDRACDIRTQLSTGLEPRALQGLPPVVASALEAAFGLPITQR